jgi:hypothetical protein
MPIVEQYLIFNGKPEFDPLKQSFLASEDHDHSASI